MYKNIVVSVILAIAFIGLFGLHISGAATIQQVGSTSLYIFGVSTQPNGSVIGVPAKLSLVVTQGSGKVFLGSTPLTGTDTQAQAVVSALVACELVNVNCDNYNFYYYIQSESPQISGPSAGAAFAVAAMSILTGHPLNPKVAMTGTANPDGSIGLVGDVAAKSEAAANQGMTLFLYPVGEPPLSSDNMTQQAIEYDAAHGMATVPVDSLYLAYQYFTGYNITPELNYNITTPFYNKLMQNTYQEFNVYQQTVYDSLPSKTSSNSSINSLINSALATMQQEEVLVSQGNYYTAASYIVNTSATDLIYARTLEELNTQSDPVAYMDSLIASENASISQTYHSVTEDYLTNMSTLDLKFIAIDRLAQASTFLDNASSSAQSNIPTAAYFYALSEVKRVSSIFWLSLLPRGDSNFSEASYYNLSQYYLYKASSYINYAGLLNPNAASSGASTSMQDFFNKAQYRQEQGNYISSIFDSLESIASAELVIEENSIVLNSSVPVITNEIIDSALRNIDRAESAGVTPFLGISYYQFGENFANTSTPLLIEYESYSRVYTDFEASLANVSFVQSPALFQPISTTLPFNSEYILYLLLGVVLGIAIGGFIYEYKLFKMVKKGRLGKNIKIVVTQNKSIKRKNRRTVHRKSKARR
ncbi:MAG: hypothetical protein M1433_00880 [Candidatus Parvarchaeota archaeon]|nr:hypothetical protein [Candidatus Parvarchaeota archaeon]